MHNTTKLVTLAATITAVALLPVANAALASASATAECVYSAGSGGWTVYLSGYGYAGGSLLEVGYTYYADSWTDLVDNPAVTVSWPGIVAESTSATAGYVPASAGATYQAEGEAEITDALGAVVDSDSASDDVECR